MYPVVKPAEYNGHDCHHDDDFANRATGRWAILYVILTFQFQAELLQTHAWSDDDSVVRLAFVHAENTFPR